MHQSGYSVVWLPLREEYSEKIVESHVWTWFDSLKNA